MGCFGVVEGIVGLDRCVMVKDKQASFQVGSAESGKSELRGNERTGKNQRQKPKIRIEFWKMG